MYSFRITRQGSETDANKRFFQATLAQNLWVKRKILNPGSRDVSQKQSAPFTIQTMMESTSVRFNLTFLGFKGTNRGLIRGSYYLLVTLKF